MWGLPSLLWAWLIGEPKLQVWEFGVIHQLGLLLQHACVILFVFLSQDDTAFLGRMQEVGGYELNPDFRKISWWWWYWTHSLLIQVESTWKVVYVETEELVGQTVSNPHFSGSCSLLQTLQNSRAMVGSWNPVSGDLFEYMLHSMWRPCRMCLFIWSEKERKNSYHLSRGVTQTI